MWSIGDPSVILCWRQLHKENWKGTCKNCFCAHDSVRIASSDNSWPWPFCPLYVFLYSGREGVTMGNSQDSVLLSDIDPGWSNSCYGHRDRLTDPGDHQRGVCRLHYVNNCSSPAHSPGLWSDHGANTGTGEQGGVSASGLVVPCMQAELREQLHCRVENPLCSFTSLVIILLTESVATWLWQNKRWQNFFTLRKQFIFKNIFEMPFVG